MTSDREVELKLEVGPNGAATLLRHPLLANGPGKNVDQLSIYYDTPDGALRSAGFSLRVRKAGSRFVQTVKQSAGASAGLFDRPEWEVGVAGFDPDLDAAAATPLGAVLGKKVRKHLQPVIRVEAHRSTWMLDRDGSSIEFVLDQGSVEAGGEIDRIGEVELELKRGDAAKLFDLARELAGSAPLRLGVLTKAERGYRLADGSSGKAAKSEPILLGPEMTSAEGFAAIAQSCLRQFRLNERLLADTLDASVLHQTRVAMRRLRSAFTLFRPVIGGRRFEELREEVRWFTDQLGDARNIDVLLKRFGSHSNKTGKALVRTLQTERGTAYAQVLEALASDRLRTLMLELAAWIETGAWRSENEAAALPLSHFAKLQLNKRWKKVSKVGRHLNDIDPEARHRLRIEVKKLRYAVEFLTSLTNKPEAMSKRQRFARSLEALQETLGELNDHETAGILLANILRDGADSAEMLRYAMSGLEAPESQEKQIEAAQEAHAQLLEVGRFWR